MELLDRYLKAVGTYLPADQRDDILRELSEDIRSEMEEKESELARPLTAAEQEAILKRHGNPIRRPLATARIIAPWPLAASSSARSCFRFISRSSPLI
jgi:hypothetical protein